MTDNLPATETNPAPDPFRDWEIREKLKAKAIGLNKTNILEALKFAGIASVVIAFDGSGDSGGIESVACHGGQESIPDVTIDEWRPGDKNTLTGTEGVKLDTAIENFAYDLLEHTQAGWENDAGAFGDITIDVEAGCATHTHNTRFEDCHTSTYSC